MSDPSSSVSIGQAAGAAGGAGSARGLPAAPATRPTHPTPAESRLPLTGADCFLRAFDAQTRRVTGASHLSQLVLRLGPGTDVEALRRAIAAVSAACPIVGAPIRRSARGVARSWGAPVYRLDLASAAPPPLEVHDAELPAGCARPEQGAPIPELFFARLNARVSIRRGELLRFDLVRYRDGDSAGADAGADLAMTWAHMLMDGSGSESFVAHLAAVAAGERAASDVPGDEWSPDAALAPAGSFKERGDGARRWHAHLQGMAAAAPRSIAGPLRRGAQDLRFDVMTLDAEDGALAIARAREKAGFLTPMLFYLAASIRAHDAVFRARGIDPGSYVVPLPVNVRPRGSEGALFRTRVSMLWFQVRPELAHDLDALIDELKSQRHAMIKDAAVENGIAAMDMARYAPMRLYAHMARRSFGGELCSFFFAYTGDFLPGTEKLAGAEILNGFHTPSVPASPGSGSILSLREGRLNAVHVHQRGAFSRDELELYADVLRRDLLGPQRAGPAPPGGGAT